jgi:mannonate dehydratase
MRITSKSRSVADLEALLTRAEWTNKTSLASRLGRRRCRVAGRGRGSGQIMGSVEGWKRLVDIVPSPYNGITFDCGVTREMGHDPLEVCRWFGKRDCINHVHFRNVILKVPREQYTEVFPDEGEVNMFGVMKELVRQKYPRLVYPEHPRGLDADREQPKSGQYAAWAFNVAYARAMLQAAMEAR